MKTAIKITSFAVMKSCHTFKFVVVLDSFIVKDRSTSFKFNDFILFLQHWITGTQLRCFFLTVSLRASVSSCLPVCPCDPGHTVLVGFLKAHFNSPNLEQSTDAFTLNEHRENSLWQGGRACFPAKGGRAVQRRTCTVYSFQNLKTLLII